MNRDWMEHQRQLRENRANGIGSDPREETKDYDEIHGPRRYTREDAESDDFQDKRAEYRSPEHLDHRDREAFDQMDDAA